MENNALSAAILPLGTLIKNLRNIYDKDQVVARLDLNDAAFVTASGYSDLENNRSKKPSIETLVRIARNLGTSHYELTQLLCAADYMISPQGLVAARRALVAELAAFEAPSVLIDYRGFLHAWNDAFAHLVMHPPLLEGAADEPLDASVARAGEGRQEPSELAQGLHWFTILFSAEYAVREYSDDDDWRQWIMHELRHFRLVTRRYNQEKWGGEPQWLRTLIDELADIPTPEDRAFLPMWSSTQEESERSRRLLPLTPAHWSLGGVSVTLQRQRYLVQTSTIASDARLQRVRFEPARH